MKRYIKILRRAKRRKLPERMTGDDASVVLELKGLGYMSAMDTTDMDGHKVQEPAITLPGEQYLAEQQRVAVWARGAVGLVVLAVLTAAALKLFGLQ